MTPLVRLRADPRKIRVSIRKSTNGWFVQIRPVGSFYGLSLKRSTPERAIEDALLWAQDLSFAGIDRYCEWTYSHPQIR